MHWCKWKGVFIFGYCWKYIEHQLLLFSSFLDTIYYALLCILHLKVYSSLWDMNMINRHTITHNLWKTLMLINHSKTTTAIWCYSKMIIRWFTDTLIANSLLIMVSIYYLDLLNLQNYQKIIRNTIDWLESPYLKFKEINCKNVQALFVVLKFERYCNKLRLCVFN